MKSVHFKSTKYRDIMIKLSLLCEETEITGFVDSIDDLEILMQNSNPITKELFEAAFTETRYTKKIDTADWTTPNSKTQLRA